MRTRTKGYHGATFRFGVPTPLDTDAPDMFLCAPSRDTSSSRTHNAVPGCGRGRRGEGSVGGILSHETVLRGRLSIDARGLLGTHLKEEGGRMFKKLCLLFGVATLAASVGCIANHKYGCENTSLVAAGSPEGQVFMQHGGPDQ